MFNLTVDEAHTFYVGTNGWLVHNCGPISLEAGIARSNQLRQTLNVDAGRSVAYADVSIPGFEGQIVGWSGDAVKSSSLAKRLGVTFAENPTVGGERILDGERKILESLRAQLPPGATGEINLFIDAASKANNGVMGACQFCSNAILQFRRDFPGIKLNVTAR